MLQPNNGLHIKNFEGDENDEEFALLKDDLKSIILYNILDIVMNKYEDTRIVLEPIREKMRLRYEVECKEREVVIDNCNYANDVLDESKNNV